MKILGKENYVVLKWVFHYLRGIGNYYIAYNSCSNSKCGYVCSNFASDLDKKRSTSGYVFTLVGGEISWMSKK